MSVDIIGDFPLGGINVSLAASVTLVVPLLAQIDLLLAGSFGLGPLLADLSLQLSASISIGISLGLSISNPFLDISLTLNAVFSLVASIQASLALGLPQISVQLSVSLSASLAIGAALSLQVGGISLLISASLALKLPVVSLMAQIGAALSAGPIVLLSFGYASPVEALSLVGTDFGALASTGITTTSLTGVHIAPSDPVYGAILLTKDPTAAAAMGLILMTH